MAAEFAIKFGGLAVTMVPAAENSTLYDELFLVFPASGGVGEIYHGAPNGAPATMAEGVRGVATGVAVGVGVGGDGGDSMRTTRNFGAEEVYNMLITTLFLLFVLTTVALLIFLLMRRPPCCPCCQDPYDTSASAAGSTGSQAANITYLTETHGIVVKKWMKDSPPPYESPPDYNSLSPELIMDAKSLQELVNTSQTPTQTQGLSAGVHNPTTSAGNQGRSPSPLCTTPLFSPSFCDSPRSLTPTMHQESKLLGVYDRPPSPIFTHHQYPSSTSTHCHPSTTAPLTVPSAAYGQPAATPPPYDSLRLYPHDGGRRKEDNQ